MARSLTFSWLAPLGVCAAVTLSGCGGTQPANEAANQFKPAETNAGDTKPVATELAATESTPAEAKKNDETPATERPVKKPTPIAVDELDIESMPDGPPEKILEYMTRMDGYEPRGVTNDAKRADFTRVLRLVMEAGDRVMVHPESTDAQRFEAAKIKLSALNGLVNLREPKADQDLLAYCKRLSKDKSADVSSIGRLMLFGMEVAKLETGELDDPQPIVAELKVLLEGKDEEKVVFMMGNKAAQVLVQIGQNKAAGEVFRMLGEKYQTDKDPKIASTAKQLLKQVKLIELDFPGKLNALFAEKPKPEAPDELMAVMTTLLAAEDAGVGEVSVAAMTADRLERTEHYEHAAALLDMMEKKFGAATDPEIAAESKDALVNGRKRLALLGKPLPIAGKLLDGQPFDPASLQGKIVLVDFWATWCGPCLAEIPSIKRYYAMYHDKGFEVIGYNIDDEQQQVDQFFANQKLPWPTIMSNDKTKIGFDSPLAVHCGVKAIPFLVLLDGDGKVIALHPRGERLGAKLAELLGPVEEKDTK